MQNPWAQSVRDKAAYRARKEEEARLVKRRSTIQWLFWPTLIFSLCGFAIYKSNEDRDRNNQAVQAKYSKWLAYRDTNCTVAEKAHGISVQSGKFATKDNATVYACTDGVKYIISESSEQDIRRGIGQLDAIPDIK